MNDVETTSPTAAGASRRTVIWIWAIATFAAVFAFVCFLGADRLTSNPKDVLGTSALFAALASVLGARIGWRLANRK
jgi:hypothetical protein